MPLKPLLSPTEFLSDVVSPGLGFPEQEDVGRGRREAAEHLFVGGRRFDVLTDAVRTGVDPGEVDVSVDAPEDGAEYREDDENDETGRNHVAHQEMKGIEENEEDATSARRFR